MSAAALAAVAVLLGSAAAWELAGSREEELRRLARAALVALTGGRLRTIGAAALWLRVPQRLERAGLAGRVPVAAVLGGKLAGCGLGAGLAALASPAVLPGRLSVVVALALPAAGFIAPEALLERAARHRRARMIAALPEALDLLAVGTAAGRSPTAVLTEISRGLGGPMAAELSIAVAEIECGTPQREAIAALKRRNAGGGIGAGLGALASALERSRRFGSPLADQLYDQAMSLRTDARRRVEERAARAAPKIQLVVALVLVPSVLLMILAALVAHADALFGPL